MVRSPKPRVLFICGSLNQTRQMHQVAGQLPEFTSSFTPFYVSPALDLVRRFQLAENTVLGNKLRARCLTYLAAHDLPVDLAARTGGYELVVSCTDLVVPSNVRRQPLVIVQEGMTDPENWLSRGIRQIGILPPWLAGTALTGVSGRYDRLCVASEGYRALFVRRGAPADKIRVTGIPNFDDCARYKRSIPPDRHYVLACTSDLRETFRRDDRAAFIASVRRAAAGRPVHFKLHPNEQWPRASREIARHCPGARVHTEGSAELLVAHCDVLFTQYSSVAFVGLALGKEVHSYFALAELRALLPIQNGGRSAGQIAQVCRELLGMSAAAAPSSDSPNSMPRRPRVPV